MQMVGPTRSYFSATLFDRCRCAGRKDKKKPPSRLILRRAELCARGEVVVSCKVCAFGWPREGLEEDTKAKDRPMQGRTDLESPSRLPIAIAEMHATVPHGDPEMARKLPFGASGRCHIHVRSGAEASAITVDQNPPLSSKLPTVSDPEQRIPEAWRTARAGGFDGGMNVQGQPPRTALRIKSGKHFASYQHIPKHKIEVYFSEGRLTLSGKRCPHKQQVARPFTDFEPRTAKICGVQGTVCASGRTRHGNRLARSGGKRDAGAKYRSPRQRWIQRDVPAIGALWRFVRRLRRRGGLSRVACWLERSSRLLVYGQPTDPLKIAISFIGHRERLWECVGAKEKETKEKQRPLLPWFRLHWSPR